VIAMTAYQFVLCALGEGDDELEKHLFLFQAGLDLRLGALALCAFRRT
jgi:hypothetical protein